MSKSKGWVSIDRALRDHWIWEAQKTTKLKAWLDLIMGANHKAAKIDIKGVLISLERGQQARSMLTLSKDWNWSRDKVKRFLKRLENEGMIKLETSQLTSIITICKYSEYQDSAANNKSTDKATDKSAEKQQKNIRQGNEQVTNNNVNNENNVNKENSSEPETPALIQFDCSKEEIFKIHQKDIDLWQSAYPAVDLQLELNKIKVWLLANPTKIKTKRGMPKFITNWFGRTQDKGGNRNENTTSNGSRPDNSAVGRVRAGIERENRQREDSGFLDANDSDVRPSLDKLPGGGSGSNESMASFIEGDFSRSD